MIAAICALVVGLITPVKGLLYGTSAPLANTVTATLETLGQLSIPLILVGVGARLSRGPRHSGDSFFDLRSGRISSEL